jgi:hypothetical protein
MHNLLFVISLALVISCNNGNGNADNSTINNEMQAEHNKESVKEAGHTVMVPSLTKKIESMIADHDSLIRTGRLDTRIFNVFFDKEKDACYVTVVTSHFYDSQMLIGFTFLNGYMIAFYNTGNGCSQELVDLSRLETDAVKGYPDESSDTTIHTTYEPWGRKYKIHSTDSLELIKCGYF